MNIHGVTIIPLIHYKDNPNPNLILIANYRPPINNYDLEFPAGYIKPKETIENCAR